MTKPYVRTRAPACVHVPKILVASFRHNRRKTNGVGRIAARVIEKLVVQPPRTMRQIIDETKHCRWFASNQVTTA
jgi:hypothetical protein